MRKVGKNCDFLILNLKITQKPEFSNEWIWWKLLYVKNDSKKYYFSFKNVSTALYGQHFFKVFSKIFQNWLNSRYKNSFFRRFRNFSQFRNCDLLENQIALCCDCDLRSEKWIVLVAKLRFFRNRNSQFCKFAIFRNPFYNPVYSGNYILLVVEPKYIFFCIDRPFLCFRISLILINLRNQCSMF